MHLVAVAAAATIVIGPAQNGRLVHAPAGAAVVVRLPGNATTGYRWTAASVPPSLRKVAFRYQEPPQGRLGQGGTFVFRFAARRGSGTLRLVYHRPWQTVPPLRTFSIRVRVP